MLHLLDPDGYWMELKKCKGEFTLTTHEPILCRDPATSKFLYHASFVFVCFFNTEQNGGGILSLIQCVIAESMLMLLKQKSMLQHNRV